MPTVEGLQFSYALHELAPGRFGFRRWRWELWHGARMEATGWHVGRIEAERALRLHAARVGHGLFGLAPPVELPVTPTRPGATIRFEAGPVAIVLVPLGAEPLAA